MPALRNAYVDESGHPQLRTSIVGFLDILGFSNVAMSQTRPEDSQHVLERIVAAIDDSRNYVRELTTDIAIADANLWEVKFFSDNLVLGYPCDPVGNSLAQAAWFIIRCAQRYQLRMALNGIFLRGALTHGPICLTDEIIFGTALIECYQLESKASIVPRVLMAEPLQQALASSLVAEASQFPPAARESVCRDVDGWWFVNYLEAACNDQGVNWDYIERHKRSILESLSTTTRHDVLPKYGWSCRYHNLFCHWHRDDPGHSDRYRIDRADEQSTMYRLSEVRNAPP